jgi:hypothetical protein
MRSPTIGHGHQHGFNVGLLHLLEQSSGSEDLIVGVRSDNDEPPGPPLLEREERAQAASTEPRLLVRPGVQVVDD